jgi:hypothetical protein
MDAGSAVGHNRVQCLCFRSGSSSVAERQLRYLKSSEPQQISRTGSMLPSKPRCPTKHQATSGSARRATSRATNTMRLEAGCISTSKVSSTTAKLSQLQEKLPLSTRAILPYLQWAITHRCSPEAVAAPAIRAKASACSAKTMNFRRNSMSFQPERNHAWHYAKKECWAAFLTVDGWPHPRFVWFWPDLHDAFFDKTLLC